MHLRIDLEASRARVAELVEALRSLARLARREAGCLESSVWVDDAVPPRVRYEEQWATDGAIRARVRSEDFTRLLSVLEAASVPPTVAFDFVHHSMGLDFVVAARHEEP